MGLEHELTKLRMIWTHFMGQKGSGAKCKHFIVFNYEIYNWGIYMCKNFLLCYKWAQ